MTIDEIFNGLHGVKNKLDCACYLLDRGRQAGMFEKAAMNPTFKALLDDTLSMIKNDNVLNAIMKGEVEYGKSESES